MNADTQSVEFWRRAAGDTVLAHGHEEEARARMIGRIFAVSPAMQDAVAHERYLRTLTVDQLIARCGWLEAERGRYEQREIA